MASHDEVAICPYCQKTFSCSTNVLKHLRFCKKNPHTIGTGPHRSVKKSHRLRARDIRYTCKAPRCSHAASPRDAVASQQDALEHANPQPFSELHAAPGANAGAGAGVPFGAATQTPAAALDGADLGAGAGDGEFEDSFFASEPYAPAAAAAPGPPQTGPSGDACEPAEEPAPPTDFPDTPNLHALKVMLNTSCSGAGIHAVRAYDWAWFVAVLLQTKAPWRTLKVVMAHMPRPPAKELDKQQKQLTRYPLLKGASDKTVTSCAGKSMVASLDIKAVLQDMAKRHDVSTMMPVRGAGTVPDPMHVPAVQVPSTRAEAVTSIPLFQQADELAYRHFERNCPGATLTRLPGTTWRAGAGLQAPTSAGGTEPSTRTYSGFASGECMRVCWREALADHALPMPIRVFLDDAVLDGRSKTMVRPLSIGPLCVGTAHTRSTCSSTLVGLLSGDADLSDTVGDGGLQRHLAKQAEFEELLLKPIQEGNAAGAFWASTEDAEAAARLTALGVSTVHRQRGGRTVYHCKVRVFIAVLSLDFKEAWVLLNLKQFHSTHCSCPPPPKQDPATGLPKTPDFAIPPCVACLTSCTHRPPREHQDALDAAEEAHRKGMDVTDSVKAVLNQRKYPQHVCACERYSALFPGGSPYAARPTDRTHVMASAVTGEKVWGLFRRGWEARGVGTQKSRKATFEARAAACTPHNVDGVRVMGLREGLSGALFSGPSKLTAEERLATLPWLPLLVGRDDQVVGQPQVLNALQAACGMLEVLVHLVYGRAVAGAGDPCRLAQWCARAMVSFQLVEACLASADRDAADVTYPKAHAITHMGWCMWWFGSLEAVDTDIGETFHTVVNRLHRSTNLGVGGASLRVLKRATVVASLKAAPWPPLAGFKASPDGWAALARQEGGDLLVPVNPDGMAWPTVCVPIKSRVGRAPDISEHPCKEAIQTWLDLRETGSGWTLRQEDMPDDVPLWQLAQCDKVRLTFSSGITNTVQLPAYVDNLVLPEHEAGAPCPSMQRELLDVALCLCPHLRPKDVPDPRHVWFLCRTVDTSFDGVSGWHRVEPPTTGAQDWRIVNGSCFVGRACTHVAQHMAALSAASGGPTRHWLRAGPSGKQRNQHAEGPSSSVTSAGRAAGEAAVAAQPDPGPPPRDVPQAVYKSLRWRRHKA